MFAGSPSCHAKLDWSPNCDSEEEDDDIIEILPGEASDSESDSDIECVTKEVSRRLSIEDTYSSSPSMEQRIMRTVTYDSDVMSDTMSDDSVKEQLNTQQHDTVSCATNTAVPKKKRISFPPKNYLSDSSDESGDDWLYGTHNRPQKSNRTIGRTVQSKPTVHVETLDQDDTSDSDTSISPGVRAEQCVPQEVVDLCSP